jgi:hypothetical protein
VMYVILVIAVLATVAAIFAATIMLRKQVAVPVDVDQTESEISPRQTPVPREPYEALTDSARQRQQEEIQKRMASGRCLHCEEPATHSVPRWRLVAPLLSPVYRYLGVVPIDHWTLETHVRSDGDKALCEWHHHEAVALMQEKDGDLTQKYARLVRDVRAERMEFQRHALYEEQASCREVVHSRGKKPKRGRNIATVTPLQANGTNGR